MKSLKETIDESIIITMTLGPLLSLVIGAGTFGVFNELNGHYDVMDVVRNWWKNSKASEIIRKLMNDSDIENLQSKPKYIQNNLLYNILDSKLSQKDLDVLANLAGNKIKAEI